MEYSNSLGVNELGEVVLSQGLGSSNVVGFLPTDCMPVNSGGLKVSGQSKFGQTYHIARGGSLEIQAANDWLAANGGGIITLAQGSTYIVDTPIVIDANLVSIYGNGATLDATTLPSGSNALHLRSIGDSTDLKYPRNQSFRDFILRGNSVQSRDFDVTGIYVSANIPTANVRCWLERIQVQHFKYGVRLQNRCYFLRGYGIEVFRCKFALYQDSPASDFAENVTFFGSTFGNSDCILKDVAGQRWRFFGCSFDYHGDATGGRITADDRLFDLRSGSVVECHGCHFEWGYGDVAGQTNSPFKLQNANTRLIINKGVIYKTGGQSPYYSSVMEMDNSSQWIVVDNCKFVNLGRSDVTHDDCLVNGSNISHTGTSGRLVIRNTMPDVVDKTDLPSTGSYTWGSSLLRSGPDDPYSELIHRISVTGTSVVANTAGATDGSVTARNSTGKMIKITGQGKVLISFPVYEPLVRHAWSLFLNSSQAVGTITVKERHSTAVLKWDGTTLATTADARAQYASATKTITAGGTNQFERVSWKDCYGDTTINPRMNNQVFAIEIDTSLMTSGSLYLDDVGFTLM